MSSTHIGFLDERRLLHGPWQAFERDVARLLIANGFDDVRIVAGCGDHGADVLGVQRGELWVFQCKHTTNSPPPKGAISEVVAAGQFYNAQRLVVATSRPPGDAFFEEKHRFERGGLKIQTAEPRTLLGMMANSPEYPPTRRALRSYQEGVADRFREALLDTGRAQIVLATGLGKTVVMSEVVADLLCDNCVPEGRVLVLAHTRALVEQLHRAFWFQLPKWIPTHQIMESEFPTFWEGITFGTVQSVLSNLEKMPHFGVILVDEAHHVGAEMFQRTIRELGPQMLGGVTATPWRGDGYDIDDILGPALVKIGIAEGLQQGFLSDVDYRLMADNLDWEAVQDMSRHRYSITQLNKRLIIPTRDEEAVRLIKRSFDEEQRRAGIVFSPTIAHAEEFAGMLRRYDFRAEAISSETLPRERDVLMSRFRAGQLDFVTTVDLFNEGVDVPDVDMLVFLRATHSRRIFVQQLGRGLRVSPGKSKVVVLDFVTDLRRVAEVVDLDRAVRGEDIEHLGLGSRIIQFHDASAGGFLQEWMLDQASLILRESDPQLTLPEINFPRPPSPGGVQ